MKHGIKALGLILLGLFLSSCSEGIWQKCERKCNLYKGRIIGKECHCKTSEGWKKHGLMQTPIVDEN